MKLALSETRKTGFPATWPICLELIYKHIIKHLVSDAPRNWSISSQTPRTWFPDLSTEETESSTEETGANFVEPVSTTTEAVSRRTEPSSSRNEPSSSTSEPTTIEQGSSSSMVLSNFFTMTVVCTLTQYVTISKS